MKSRRDRALARLEELEATLEDVRSPDVRALLIALRDEERERIAALDRACASSKTAPLQDASPVVVTGAVVAVESL